MITRCGGPDPGGPLGRELERMNDLLTPRRLGSDPCGLSPEEWRC